MQTSRPRLNFPGRALRGFLAFRLILVLAVLLLTSVYTYTRVDNPVKVSAAPNSAINYQARLLSSAGNTVPDGNYFIEFNLYTAESGGVSVWTERYQGSAYTCPFGTSTGATNAKVRVVNGYLSVPLGSLCTFPSTINWDQEMWLTMNIGGSGATAVYDGEMTPRLKLTAVPYALMAGTLAKTSGVNRGTLSFGTIANNPSITLPDASGTVCLQASTSCSFASATGSTNYIQNGTSLQTAANFNIQATSSTTVGTIGGIIRGASGGQTADLLQLQSSAGVLQSAFHANGDFTFNTNSGADYLKLASDTLSVERSLNITSDAAALDQRILIQASGNTHPGRITLYGDNYAGSQGVIRSHIGNNANSKYVISYWSGAAETDLASINTAGQLSLPLQGVNAGIVLGTDTNLYRSTANTLKTDDNFLIQTATDSATAFVIQNAAGATLLNSDTTTGKLTVSQGNLVVTGLGTVAAPTIAAASNQAGSLSGSSATTYYYKVSALNGAGETLASSESSINGASFTPLAVPGAPTVAINAVAGNLNGAYTYKVTFVTANGETTGGTTSASVSPASQQVNLSAIPTGPTGTTARKIYRTAAAGADGTQKLVTTIADNTTTIYTDNLADASLGAVLPASNTARTDTNNATITFTAVSGATSYRIYRGTTPNGQNAYQTTTSSPFTDTGAAGTAATPPASDATARLGVGTSAPSASLHIAGTALFKNASDSTTAFQIQNAAGTSLLNVDTANAQIEIASNTIVQLDGVTGNAQLKYVSGSNATQLTNYNAGGGVQIQAQYFQFQNSFDYAANLTIDTNGSALFKNRLDSATAFQIQNAAAVSLLTADTSVGRISLYAPSATNSTTTNTTWLRSPKNTVTAFFGDNDSTAAYTANEASANLRFNGAGVAWGDFGYYPNGDTNSQTALGNFRLSTTGTAINAVPDARLGVGSLYIANNTATQGIQFGGDVNLYRSAANILRTDDGFDAAGRLSSGNGTANQIHLTTGGQITFGSAEDTNLYRSAANTLQTDDSLVVAGKILQGGYLNPTGDNLLYNGDFESGNTNGWTAITSVVAGGRAGNYTSQTTGSSQVLSDDYIPVDPVRDVLQLEGYFKKTVTGVTPGVLFFGYIAYDGNKTAITTAPCGTYCYFAAANTTIPADGAWHKYSATTNGEGTAYPNFPVGTKYVRVLGLINYGASADEVTQMDHVTLKRINNGALFVGNNFSASNMSDQYQQSKIYTNASSHLILEPAAGGNVGIGTTAPASKLEVNESANNMYAGRFIQTNVTASNGLYIQTQTVSSADVALHVTSNAGANVLLTVRNSGTVGIGISNPSAALHVKYAAANSSATSPVLIVDNPTGGSQTAISFRINNAAVGSIRSDSSGNIILSGTGAGATYLGYDGGTGGVLFGNGASGTVGSVTAAGVLNVQTSISVGGTGVITQGGNDVYANVRVLRSQSTLADGMYINYGGSGGSAKIYDGGTTNSVQVTAGGNLQFGQVGAGPISIYDPVKTQAVFAMGAAYTLPIGGGTTTYGNFYGLGWSYNPDYGGAGNNPQSKAGLNHQLLVMNAGVTQTAIGTGIWTNGNMTVGGGGGKNNLTFASTAANTGIAWANNTFLYSPGFNFLTTDGVFEAEDGIRVTGGSSGNSINGGMLITQLGGTVLNLNRGTNDGTLISLQQNAVEQGSITVSGTTVSYNAFTGSHYAITEESIDKYNLVTLTGNNAHLGDRAESEFLYGVKNTTAANDPNVMGVYLSVQEPSQPQSHLNPSLIMAVGNGDVWVVDNGKNLSSSDYLISSDVAGHAMADPGNYAVSHIFAKVAEPVDWSTVTETINGRKHKKVSVFFTSFDKPNNDVVLQGSDAVFDNLNVTGSTNLSSLNVSGPTTLTSLTVTGDVTIQGKLTVTAIEVGNITVSGHIITAGATPTGQVLGAVGTGAKVTVEGNDTAGTLTITTGSSEITPGDLAKITFKKAFGKIPKITLSAQDEGTDNARIFPGSKTMNDYLLKTSQTLPPNTTYTFDYFIVE